MMGRRLSRCEDRYLVMYVGAMMSLMGRKEMMGLWQLREHSKSIKISTEWVDGSYSGKIEMVGI